MTWTPDANSEKHEVMYRRLSGVPVDWSMHLAPVTGRAGRGAIYGLIPCQHYELRVRAGRGNIWSPWSERVESMSGPAPDPFFTPADVKAAPGDNPGEVLLSWKSGADAKEHQLQYREKGSNAVEIISLNSASTRVGDTCFGQLHELAIDNLYAGGSYEFRVRAVRMLNLGERIESEWSDWVESVAEVSLQDREALTALLYRVLLR